MPLASAGHRSAGAIRGGVAVGLVLLSALSLTGCSKASPGGTGEAAEAGKPHPDDGRGADQTALEGVVLLDVRASKAMREADAAAHAGDTKRALELVTTRARPAVDEGLRAGEAVVPKTAWGTAKRDELLGILRDRKTEMPRYEEAIRTGDPEKMLSSVEAQAGIERRALAVVGSFETPGR